jgi:TP901 family phage tail tape measure protein
MAEENLVTNIVAKSNFSDLIGDLNRVSSRLLTLKQSLDATNKSLAVQAAQMQKSFSDTMRSTGQFSTHFVSLQNDVEKFGRGLDSGRLKLGQYYGAWKEHSRTTGGLIRDLARQQVQLQNSVIQPMGKNAQGIMQYAVHVPRGLDEIKSKTAIARQEMMIMNKVIQDGANQVINWGKNTQWAGRQLTVGLTLPIVMFGKAAADAFREADEQLVRLTKVYGGLSATSATELAKVRKEVAETARALAREYGAAYKETIGLAADIAATGQQGEQLLKSTREATRLSILGEVDRQEAMKATLAIQSAFKQNTQELTESINFLNAVENQTSTSLADLVEAIPKAGPVVKALGGDVQDLALYLTAMREGGINASEGANALKSALASIINPTKVAKAMFMDFGINLEEIVSSNAGNLTGTILELQRALDSLNPLNKAQAIEQLFGKFQFARLNALFENLGKQGSQTLQVLDLMKASSDDLANIASRELSQITESASGKYRRALETLKADLAGVGEQFLNIATKVINVLDGVIRFFNKLPDPIKKLLTFVASITALAGPIIMLTGLFANFFGYIAKGLFHLRALIKGGEGFKLLTPEIVAAQQAGQLMETQFYDDAKAAAVLKQAISNLTTELSLLETKANSARIAVGPAITTMAGSVITPGQARVADPSHPLIGRPYSRAFAHLNPVAGMTEEERLGQTIFGVAPNPQPLNQKISNNPQMYMDTDLPRVDRVSSAKGFSTGIVAAEAARWHSMTAALAMQSKEEIALLKSEVAATGTVTTSLSTSYQALLPEMTRITSLAAQEGALIVKQLEAGKLTVDQARAKIILLNQQVEAMMAQTAQAIATQQGRNLSLSTVPLTAQPIVDPRTGKSNMKELFHKGPTASLVDQIARSLGVKTSGGGYSIETTKPRRFNAGGKIESFGPNKTTVSGPRSITYDDRLGMIPLGGYVLNQRASLANPELAALAPLTYNKGGEIVAELTPQETIFGPGIRAIPGLYQAVDAANKGQSIGGTITPGRRNYGIRYSAKGRSIVDTKTITKLWRQVFGKGGADPKPEYEPKGTTGFFGGDVVSKLGEKISTTRLNKLLETGGVSPNVLLASIMSRTSRGRLSTDVFLRGLRDAGIISAAEERRLSRQIFTKYASTIRTMDKVNDKNNPIYSVSDSVIRQELVNVKNRADVERLWTEFSRQPGSFADASRRSSSNFLTRLTAGDKTISLDRLEGVGKGEKFFHAKSTDNPMYAELERMHARQPFGENPGGLPASRLAELTSRWKTAHPMTPAVQRHDWTNTDPLHGPLFIGRADIGGEGVRRSISYSLPENPKYIAGISPMMSSDPRYLIERYMAGDKAVLARMQDESRKGLNPHPLSIQSIFRSVARPYTGTLYRGMTSQSVADTLPKHIVEAIELAKLSGNMSALIGKDFIMRRASFSSDPKIADFFSPGSGGLLLQASLFGRKVTPTSEMFPDKKFQAPYSQDWSGGHSGRRYRSEQESLVGGRFIITGFDGKKLIVEGRAMGGAVSGATPYMVGEQGPELFVPESSGKIIPNRYMAGGDIVAGRSAYGISGNPAKRAQQEAEKEARRAAFTPTPAPQTPSAPGPLTGSRTTVIGAGGVRTNVYGVQGSLPYMPGLTLGHQTLNRMQAALASASQQVGMSLYALGTSIKKDSVVVGQTIKYTGQQIAVSAKLMVDQTKTKIDSAARMLGSAAGTMILAVDKMATSTKAAASRFLSMPNPGYAAGFSKNFAYGTSLMMMPFGRRAGGRGPQRDAQGNLIPIGGGNMASMATWMGGSMAGGAVGKQVGGETGALVGSIAGPMAIMGVLKLVNSLRAARLAGTGVSLALRTMLGVIGRFIPIIGPLLAIGQALNVWRRHSEDIGKANRAVFGPTEKSLKEVGLKYQSLNDRLKEYRQQLELTRAKAASSGQGGTQVSGLTLSLKELKAGIKDAKENAKESVQLFNKTYGKNDVLQLAVSLKQQYISAGMSVQEATNKVYVLMQASNKGMFALDAISSKAFKSIQDEGTAADYAIKLVATAFKSGKTNAEEMSRGVENYVNALDAYKSSVIGTKDGDKVITEAEALKMAMEKILKNKQATVQIDYQTLSNLKAQNSELALALGTTENMASVYAKMSLMQSQFSGSLSLATMSPDEAISVAQGMAAYNAGVEKAVQAEPQINALSKTSSRLAKTYDAVTKAAQNFSTTSYEKIIKQQEAVIKQIDKELQLRLKNLEAQEKAADFATNLKKEQLKYQEALMTGDMVAAAEAKLNIQQLEKENEILLARQALQDAADKKKAAAQKIIDEQNARRDKAEADMQSAQKSAASGAASAQAINVFTSKLTTIAQMFGGRDVRELSQVDRESIQKQLKEAVDTLAASGKETADFVKTFSLTNMSGADKGLNYLANLSNQGEASALKEAGGIFKSAVQQFAEAVGLYSGLQTSYVAPTDAEIKDTFGTANQIYMQFKNPKKNTYVQIKADETNVERLFGEMVAKGYGFVKYMPGGEQGRVGTVYTGTSGVPIVGRAMGGAIPQYADGGSYAPGMGGYIKGRGTPTSDSILLPTGNGGLIRASDTEFMQPASAVSYYGTDFMEDIRARRIPKDIISAAMGGKVPGYPMGGLIPYAMGGAIPGYKDGGGIKDGIKSLWRRFKSNEGGSDPLIHGFTVGILEQLGTIGQAVGSALAPSLVSKPTKQQGKDLAEFTQIPGIYRALTGKSAEGPMGEESLAAQRVMDWASVLGLAMPGAGGLAGKISIKPKVKYPVNRTGQVTASRLGSDDLDLSGFHGPDVRTGQRLVGTENWGSLITSESDIKKILNALSAHYGVDIRPTVVREGMEGNTAGFYRSDRQSMHLPDKTRGQVVAHEATHAADYQGAYWSFKDMLEYMLKVDPAAAKKVFNEPMLNAYHVAKRGGNTSPWLYESLVKSLQDFAPEYLPYWRGLLEKNASSKIPNIKPEGLDLGNAYSAIYGGKLASMLKSSLEPGYEHVRSPKFWEAVIADENMPKHLITKGRSWIAALGRYGVTENTPADDFGLKKLIEYAKATNLAMGGAIPKFHNGGQVNTKFAGGETMALLKDKEVVFTQDQMAALGSMTSTQMPSGPASITYAPVINAAPGMDEEMLANLVMVKLGTATDIRYKANGSSGMRVIR